MDLIDPTALIGTWQLERVVEDRRLGEVSHLDGELELTGEAPGLILWVERATWHRADGDVEVSRHLRVVRTGEDWWVRFEDGSEFHPWRPDERVVHDCAPDTYRGQVSGTTQEWTVVWEVSGPAKDYTMTTLLRPALSRP